MLPGILAKVKKAAGFQPQDDSLGEYELAEPQIRQVAKILGFRPEPDRFYYCVEPYDPPDDCSFQEPPAAALRRAAASLPSRERAISTSNSSLGRELVARFCRHDNRQAGHSL